MVCHGGFADHTCIESSQEQLASICVSRGFCSTIFCFCYFFWQSFCFIPVKWLQKSSSGQGNKDSQTKIKKRLHDKQQDDNNQDEDKQQEKEGDNKNDKKWIYKKNIDICQGKKDYKKWMTTIKEMKTEQGKQGVDKVDQWLTSIISNYNKQLMQWGVDVTKKVQEIVNVADNNHYIDFEAVRICGV